ncbi:hypothetical protein AB0P21_08155 [Kribbella sp. NPDC056861]|uniref:hypothetical protein n=1 Tax=Kribbella sp. NPDC056861 TaxID=3154857 RepID=UPI003426237E
MDEQQSSDEQVPVVDGQAAYENLRDAGDVIEEMAASLREVLAADDELPWVQVDDDDSQESK